MESRWLHDICTCSHLQSTHQSFLMCISNLAYSLGCVFVVLCKIILCRISMFTELRLYSFCGHLKYIVVLTNASLVLDRSQRPFIVLCRGRRTLCTGLLDVLKLASENSDSHQFLYIVPPSPVLMRSKESRAYHNIHADLMQDGQIILPREIQPSTNSQQTIHSLMHTLQRDALLTRHITGKPRHMHGCYMQT